MSKTRPHGRADDELRPVEIAIGAMKFADGSAQIDGGDTRVLIGATIENRVPPFLINSGKGWATAEYAMLPRATSSRSQREVSRGRPSGRSSEIQRLIGRSVRAGLDLKALGERTLILDCDVLQADGGTRTAAVTGAYVAAVQALAGILLAGDISRWPVVRQIAAVSVGIVDGRPLLDLEASEDQRAYVDMNVVGTSQGEIVEVQGTGERRSFTRSEHDRLLDLALEGIAELVRRQNEILAPLMAEVEAVLAKSDRQPAPPKDEKDLWGRPG
ncbi:MAG: ribonuclease PH [Acidobacteriota bacterium]|nr:ribonuclease PH [Acidobacteriota bacterium]